MHFWIDKRSAQWGRRGCGKAMVTPVHRFQAVEAVVARSHHQHPRYPRHSSAAPLPGPTARPHTHHHAPELDAPVFLDHHHPHLACHGGVVGGGPSLAATGRLKCGMWASFALVTVFMAGAKFYFNTQSTGLEVLVFCALLVIVLFAGCAVSLCEAVTQPAPPQTGGVTTAAAAAVVMVNSVPSASTASSSSVAVSVATPAPVEIPGGPEPPPPPYHIAVLLPPPPAPPAPPSPPPAYDKAVSVS